MRWMDDFVGLFFPRVCNSCGAVLFRNEEQICTQCLMSLPKTNFHLHLENPVTEIFAGRFPIRAASAYLYFAKAGRVQRMIHQFKYKRNLELGRVMGRMFGNDLHKSQLFSGLDCVIPVPLHWSKQKARGFNQSEIFGKEIARALNIPLFNGVLVREKATETQTRKSRFERWQNVSYVFRVVDPEKIAEKNILLVDDVITTGATIEAAASTILEVPATSISLAFLAIASH